MEPNSTNAVEAVGLTKRFWPSTWALRDLDLRVPRGGIVGLVGPNGAGKSTLLRSWIGFERPTSGEARVLGLDPWVHRRAVQGRVAFLAQKPSYYRDLTVQDHLDFVGRYRGSSFDRARALAHLSDFRIPLAGKAGTLSGGQAAQLGLAIALALHAEVFLLDEPLAALDPLARREFISRLAAEVSASGATAILSSHITSDIAIACDQLIVLSTGRVQIQGFVRDLIEHHFVLSGMAGVSDAQHVADLPDGGQLFRATPGAPAEEGGIRPTLDDLVLGYLTAGRLHQ